MTNEMFKIRDKLWLFKYKYQLIFLPKLPGTVCSTIGKNAPVIQFLLIVLGVKEKDWGGGGLNNFLAPKKGVLIREGGINRGW